MLNGLSPLRIAALVSSRNPLKHSHAGGEGQCLAVPGPSVSQKPSLEHLQSMLQGRMSEAITQELPSRKTLFQQRGRVLCPSDTR